MDFTYRKRMLLFWNGLFMLTFGMVAADLTCKFNQMLRNNGLHDICCNTVQCAHNQYFEPCLFHNTNDTCNNCPPKTCYDNAVHSKHFREKPSGLCKHVDSQCNINEGAYKVWKKGSCMPECKCNVSQGYYGLDDVSRGCRHTTKLCNKPGEQLSHLTGKCVPCPDGQFKKGNNGFCIEKTRCSNGSKIIDSGSTTQDIKCGFPSSNISSVTPKQKNPATTLVTIVTQSGNDLTSNVTSTQNESFPLVTFGIVFGSSVCTFLMAIIIWTWRRRSQNRATTERDELVSIESGEGSALSCDSCSNTVCTCSKSSTHVKSYYAQGTTDIPGDGLQPKDTLLTPGLPTKVQVRKNDDVIYPSSMEDGHIERHSPNAVHTDPPKFADQEPSPYREKGGQETNEKLPGKRGITFNDSGKARSKAIVKPIPKNNPANDNIEQIMNDDDGHLVPSGMSSITRRHIFQSTVQRTICEFDRHTGDAGINSLTSYS